MHIQKLVHLRKNKKRLYYLSVMLKFLSSIPIEIPTYLGLRPMEIIEYSLLQSFKNFIIQSIPTIIIIGRGCSNK